MYSFGSGPHALRSYLSITYESQSLQRLSPLSLTQSTHFWCVKTAKRALPRKILRQCSNPVIPLRLREAFNFPFRSSIATADTTRSYFPDRAIPSARASR